MNGTNDFNIENYTLTEDQVRKWQEARIKEKRGKPAKVVKWRKQFVQVPWTWIEQLAKARHIATYRVALHILYQHWKRGGKPFSLSNGAVCGVSPRQKWRALQELEGLALVKVERRPRKSPLVAVTTTMETYK
jgi:hypothetical protein